MRVIAEAYGREPLDRQIIGRQNGLCYLVPFGTLSDDIDEMRGVGFPERYVFAFDDQLLRELRVAFEAGETGQLDKLWKKAHNVLERA